jgi:hypothetical protein
VDSFADLVADQTDLYQALTKRHRKVARILTKEEVKEHYGNSPDYGDALMMRMYFELDPTLAPNIR